MTKFVLIVFGAVAVVVAASLFGAYLGNADAAHAVGHAIPLNITPTFVATAAIKGLAVGLVAASVSKWRSRKADRKERLGRKEWEASAATRWNPAAKPPSRS